MGNLVEKDLGFERIDELRAELLLLVENALSPVAKRYHYSDIPLETHIKWRPIVLILGNYSSGKSTLINELLGLQVQETGQAPTDDSFTVLSFDEQAQGEVRVTEERDGKVLLNDPQYPFMGLKKHGQRFSSHFRLKFVNSPFLRHLALIDTPGMLDSFAEKDRGYNYQEVIGDLAQIADLVLVLFDPHKAGTVREVHASLRETLPARTFEDRVLFVMNRIDECEHLNDLLRVYGTLSWNLSQMLGRKDIPQIRLTYSENAGKGENPEYLKFLANQRTVLHRQISDAPRYRLDHLASYAEMHGERLSHLLEALLSYSRRRMLYRLQVLIVAAFFVSLLSLALGGVLYLQGPTAGSIEVSISAGVFGFSLLYGLFLVFLLPRLLAGLHNKLVRDVDQLTDLSLQSRKDSWSQVRLLVTQYLQRTLGKFARKEVQNEFESVQKALKKGSLEIREALTRLPVKDLNLREKK